MNIEGITKPGSESQDSDEPLPPGTSNIIPEKATVIPKPSVGFKLAPSSKGVENAKKRLRAFSIQKKATPITPVAVNKASSGGSTVFIGKLSGVKVTPKPEDGDQKKPPKPPKPGTARRILQDSYIELQKRTLTEIEDMKRKMELVELGIPLGLIYPTSASDKAMPTKAMPPIKSFLDPAKLDEIIRKAKKAKAEGREFKFDYQRILPEYENPFQRKKDDVEKRKQSEERDYRKKIEKEREKDRRKSDKYEKDMKRHQSHRKDEKDKRKDDRDKQKDKPKEKYERKDEEQTPIEVKTKVEKETKETDVNLSDYLVCDSWSLDNEDKPTGTTSPKFDEKIKHIPIPKDSKPKIIIKEIKKEMISASPLSTPAPVQRTSKLQPVIDSFKFEIDPNEDEILDMFDESSGIEKFATKTVAKTDDIYDSPIDMKVFDFETKESNDALTDDTFLESVINEIKQEDMSDDTSQDKGLVEYDSPSKESDSPPLDPRLSVTPELDDRMRDLQSSRSDYSDGYRSTESGYKSTESGYKSSASYKSGDSKGDNYRLSMEKDVESQFNKSTVDSLETWSFVLKICQPLLFRHDRNKCYRETRTTPKIWYTENPKLCACVKDRAVVYEELETCKMSLVDRLYGCDQIPEVELPKACTWYPSFANCLMESNAIPSLVPASDWEADDSQTETPLMKDKRRSTTPLRSEEIYLDREYQSVKSKHRYRFMQAVWPDVSESKAGTPRSTTPVRQESRKKKAEDKDAEDKKKAKKIKLSSEGWSQESDIEEEVEKSKQKLKADKVKVRKRKLSISSVSDSDDTAKKRRKALKKKAKESKKKMKSKLSKRRRLNKKVLKKLKEKQKKKKKHVSEDEDIEKENRKKEKKLRKKKLQKKKKAQKKKNARAKSSSSSSSSTSSSSTSSSETESEQEKRKKKKKSDVKKKKRKQSTSESTQSEDLFDVNILNNIKTERLTDDEKNQKLVDFSPRRQKPREIINVKELQNDFVGNNIHIKKEAEDKELFEREGVKMGDFQLDSQEKEFATESAPDVAETPDVPDVLDESEVPDVPETKREVQLKEIPHPATRAEQIHQSDIEAAATDKLPDNSSSSIEKELLEPITRAEQVETYKLPDNSSPPTADKESQEINIPLPQLGPLPEESNLSQCSSQESSASKDVPYEKDDSHLRPSSQNSNYSFNDVISASQNYQKEDDEDKFQESYEQGNYEMYEQLAMAYQSDVAKQIVPSSTVVDPFFVSQSQRIETVVRTRCRGEIKCDWRAGDDTTTPLPNNNQRPSRWGLKPGEVNIVLTGGGEDFPMRSEEPVYQIQTIANRSENNSSGSYDEAYEDMYGASDRLQYGDCFAPDVEPATAEDDAPAKHISSLDDRINHALRNSVLGEVAKDTDETDADKDGPEKGILVTKAPPETRGAKRVSFADGYKPGQDSDVEEPPVKKKKKPRRFGCAWPCPAMHPDHVPLWDALPPPPPPPGDPPTPMQQTMMMQPPQMMQPPNMMQQQPPNMLQPPNMMQQPPQMMQPPNMMQPTPQMLQQSQMLQQQGVKSMLQQQGLKSMMSTPPFPMPQKMEKSNNTLSDLGSELGASSSPAALQTTRPMRQSRWANTSIDPSASLSNFLPPEPPPGLLNFS